jgi:hypothetical protein
MLPWRLLRFFLPVILRLAHGPVRDERKIIYFFLYFILFLSFTVVFSSYYFPILRNSPSNRHLSPSSFSFTLNQFSILTFTFISVHSSLCIRTKAVWICPRILGNARRVFPELHMSWMLFTCTRFNCRFNNNTKLANFSHTIFWFVILASRFRKSV